MYKEIPQLIAPNNLRIGPHWTEVRYPRVAYERRNLQQLILLRSIKSSICHSEVIEQETNKDVVNHGDRACPGIAKRLTEIGVAASYSKVSRKSELNLTRADKIMLIALALVNGIFLFGA